MLCVAAGRDASLAGRAEDEHVAAEVGAAAGQFAEVIGGGLAHGGVGRGELQAFGAGEQPVQAEQRQAAVLRLAPQLAAALRRHVGDAAGESKRRDLQSLVAEAGDELADAPMVPALKRLIADRITHGGNSKRIYRGERGEIPILESSTLGTQSGDNTTILLVLCQN